MVIENRFNGFLIAAVNPVKRDVSPSRNLLYSFKTSQIAIGHVVGDDYIIPCIYQFDGYMAAYIAGTTCD